MKIYDLPVMQGREKSFYGKARIIEKDNGEKVLQSYKTEDCEYTRAEAMKRLKEYRENIFGLVRLVKRREKRQ